MAQKLKAAFGINAQTKGMFDAPLTLSDGAILSAQSWKELGGARPTISRTIRQIEGMDFDVAEIPLVNYFSAREMGLPMTAIPVVLTRRFLHRGLMGDTRQGINEPKDLEGKMVGTAYHGHSDVTWMRGILSERYGVDLDSITWVTVDPEIVPTAPLPKNVLQIPGANFEVMMNAGELQGAVLPVNMTIPTPEVRSLVSDEEAEERAWYEAGIFPLLHTVLVKDSVLAEHPTIAQDLYDALKRSKQDAIARVIAGTTDEEAAAATGSGLMVSAADQAKRPYLAADPLLYGLEANRAGLEMLVRFSREQRVTSTQPALEELFVGVNE